MFYDDFETHALISIHDRVLGTALMDVDEVAKLEARIRDRKEMVRYGVLRCPSWFQEELNRLDSKMRAWWDSWEEKWVLDRLQDEGYYLTVIQFRPNGQFQLDRSLLEALKASDMQKYSPGEYLARKREAAEEIKKKNDQAATDKVMAAVDSLSSKQIKNFIAVEEAIRSGETITAHGQDAKFLEHAKQETQAALARGEQLDNPAACLNPGMHPRTYKRRPRKELQ